MVRAVATILGLLLLAPAVARADGARYRIEGRGPEGACRGTALNTHEPGGGLVVALKTVGPDGAERRAWSPATPREDTLSFVTRATCGLVTEPALTGRARRTGPDALEVVFTDAAGAVVRREAWRRDEEVVIPLLVVALQGGGRLPGVASDAAARAQAAIVEQLDRVYAPARLRFAPTGDPLLLSGAGYDRDDDGRLDRGELEALRADLEQAGHKRPGRVVLVLTAAPFVGPGCRGWTIGDAPATPHTLGDVNDNLSLVGLRWVLEGHHTVAHEVGHQLGLDDLTAGNRGLLEHPERADHLMQSGGDGVYLDPAVARRLREAVRWPDHGLDGRRAAGGLAD
jgi:hypothetical protein